MTMDISYLYSQFIDVDEDVDVYVKADFSTTRGGVGGSFRSCGQMDANILMSGNWNLVSFVQAVAMVVLGRLEELDGAIAAAAAGTANADVPDSVSFVPLPASISAALIKLF